MASSSSSSKGRYHADRTIFIRPIMDSLSNLELQVSSYQVSDIDDRDQPHNQVKKLCRELTYIRSAFLKLDSFGSHVGDRLSQLENCVNDVLKGGPASADHIQSELHPLASKIADLKALLLLLPQVSSSRPHTNKIELTNNGIYSHNKLFEQTTDDGGSSLQEELLADLNDLAKQLLPYFAAFPLGKVISKRVLKNWWLGDAEALLRLPPDEAENKADRVLEDLVSRCVIEAVRKQRRLVGFRISHRWVHFAVVRFAESQKFFAFDSMGNPTMELQTWLQRVCLVQTKDGRPSLGNNYSNAGLDKLVTVFNIGEPYPYIKPEFFSKAKGIRVISLGKWQISNDCHIEVESTEFLKGRKSLRDLRLFSLRGVSRVFELPDALCNLSSLTMLDLNACHSLEELPAGIGSLKNLIYLDISGCYLLEKMPKGLASLYELRVLKGFLIINSTNESSSCKFKDLAGLKKLKKLSINANRRDFPGEDDLDTFRKFWLFHGEANPY
ncbi:disease resistance RPP13-like protein 4 [Punica granatum]|uniref:Disease resistance RPP13-like protein 4 n=2 Tax=Punica granatum TaxID=22663 RepID=A0A6P8BW06_PUNGR|nr:disease resistance RPP13-like protein 4 [Punica granatum]XP_031373842.1 disease resistance RPP13-like protein 4 [Punica granatum]PKI53219.1 hypothetical protein CRG98_026351 [Punica granatum]